MPSAAFVASYTGMAPNDRYCDPRHNAQTGNHASSQDSIGKLCRLLTSTLGTNSLRGER